MLVYDMLRSAEHEHALHDYRSKQNKVYEGDMEGEQIPAQTLMNGDGSLVFHDVYLLEYFEKHDADVFVVYGRQRAD